MEEIEVPTEHLHEEIKEKAEEAKERWILYVALSTAFMAVLAAVAGLLAGHHANEAVIERVKASDSWNYYQAKNIKTEIDKNTDKILHVLAAAKTTGASGAPTGTSRGATGTSAAPTEASAAATSTTKPGEVEDNAKDIARREQEKEDIKKKAEEAEEASEWHMSKHMPLANAVTAFQIAIAISAIAILTRRKNLWYAGMLLTLIGIIFLLLGIIH